MISIDPRFDGKLAQPNQVYKHWRTVNIDDLNRIAKGICRFPWSPVVWRDGYRKKVNFLCADLLVLDFDDGEMTLAEAVENYFCDYVHIIGTTKSHQVEKSDKPPCDRFRVVIPFEKRIRDLYTYEHQLRAARRNYPIDGGCKDGGRYFAQCKEIVSVNTEGEVWNIVAPPPKRKSTPRAIKYLKNGVIPPKAREIFEHGLMPGMRNDSFFMLGLYLKELYPPEKIFDIAWKKYLDNGYEYDEDLMEELKRAVVRGATKTNTFA